MFKAERKGYNSHHRGIYFRSYKYVINGARKPGDEKERDGDRELVKSVSNTIPENNQI